MKKLLCAVLMLVVMGALFAMPALAAGEVTLNGPAAIDWGSFIEGEATAAETSVTLTNHTAEAIQLRLDDMYVSAYSTGGALLNGGGSPFVTLPANGDLTLVLKPLASASAGEVTHDWKITYAGGEMTLPVKYKVIQRVWGVNAKKDLNFSVVKGESSQGTVDVGYVGNVDKTITVVPSSRLQIVSGASLNFEGSGQEYTQTPDTPESTQTVTFKPVEGLAAGTYNETLTLQWEDSGSPYHWTLNVTLRVLESAYAIELAVEGSDSTLTPEGIYDFGTFAKGQPAPEGATLTVNNVGLNTIRFYTEGFDNSFETQKHFSGSASVEPGSVRKAVTVTPSDMDTLGVHEVEIRVVYSKPGTSEPLGTKKVTFRYTVEERLKADVTAVNLGTFVVGEVTEANQKTVTLENVTDKQQTLTFSGAVTVNDTNGNEISTVNLAANSSVTVRLSVPEDAQEGENQTGLVVKEGNLTLLTLPVSYQGVAAQAKHYAPDSQTLRLAKGQQPELALTAGFAGNVGRSVQVQASNNLVLVGADGNGKISLSFEATQPGAASLDESKKTTQTFKVKPAANLTPGTYAETVTLTLGDEVKEVSVTLKVTEHEYALAVTPEELKLGTFQYGHNISTRERLYQKATNEGAKALTVTTTHDMDASLFDVVVNSPTVEPDESIWVVGVKPATTTVLGTHTGTVTVTPQAESGLAPVKATVTYTVYPWLHSTSSHLNLGTFAVENGASALTPDNIRFVTLTWYSDKGVTVTFQGDVQVIQNDAPITSLTLEANVPAEVQLAPPLDAEVGQVTTSLEIKDTQGNTLYSMPVTYTGEAAQWSMTPPADLPLTSFAQGETPTISPVIKYQGNITRQAVITPSQNLRVMDNDVAQTQRTLTLRSGTTAAYIHLKPVDDLPVGEYEEFVQIAVNGETYTVKVPLKVVEARQAIKLSLEGVADVEGVYHLGAFLKGSAAPAPKKLLAQNVGLESLTVKLGTATSDDRFNWESLISNNTLTLPVDETEALLTVAPSQTSMEKTGTRTLKVPVKYGDEKQVIATFTYRVVDKLSADVEELDLGSFVVGHQSAANQKTVTLTNHTSGDMTLTFSGDVTVTNTADMALTEFTLPGQGLVQLKIAPKDQAGAAAISLIVTEKGGEKLLEIPVTYTGIAQAFKVNLPQHDPVEVIIGQETIFEQTIEYACNIPGTLTITTDDSTGRKPRIYLLNDAGAVVNKLEIPVEATHPGQAASDQWQMQTVTVRIKANDQLSAGSTDGYMKAQLGTVQKNGQVTLLIGEAEYKLHLTPAHMNLGEFVVGQTVDYNNDMNLVNKGTKAIDWPPMQVTGPVEVRYEPGSGLMDPGDGILVGIKPSDLQTPGQYTGQVTFASGDKCQATMTFEYTVLAQKAFTVTPAALDFGIIHEGEAMPAAQTVTVTNTGAETLEMSYLDPAGYTIGIRKPTLAKGESDQVTVRPDVNTPGDHAAKLTVSADGLENQQVALAFAVEGDQALTVEPDTLDWGDLAVGEAAPEKDVRLTNNTSRTLDLTAEATEGFNLDTDTVTLAPFGSAVVKATPDSQRAAGVKTGQVTFKDGNTLVGTVSLQYNGLPALKITPEGLDFGTILPGEDLPAPQTLTLENITAKGVECTLTFGSDDENWSYTPFIQLSEDAQGQVTIQPTKNVVGVYDTQLIIEAEGMIHRVPVKFTVAKPTGLMTVKPETTLTVTQGYAAQTVQGLVTNTGEVPLDVRYAVEGFFELDPFADDLAPGQSLAPSVRIPAGLAPSTYKATFTFTADNGDTGVWTVTLIVEPKPNQFPPTGDASAPLVWALMLAAALLVMPKRKRA